MPDPAIVPEALWTAIVYRNINAKAKLLKPKKCEGGLLVYNKFQYGDDVIADSNDLNDLYE